MPKHYETNGSTRFVNRIIISLIRFGVMPRKMHILTVRGWKSGKLYQAPVALIEQDGARYLVSPYGEVAWVKNARANGEVMITRGGQTETLHIRELTPEAAAPLLKTYVTNEAITRQYFDTPVDSPVEAFVTEAPLHPVFQLVP